MISEEQAARYRAALEEIKRDQGRVCAGFELCTHAACQSSYSSWAIADKALRAGGDPPEAEASEEARRQSRPDDVT